MLRVLSEDNHLIAVYKPAGILTQPDKSGDKSLMEEIKKYLKEKYKKPGNVFLGLLHRLDRPVCGVVLFAKTSKGASRLSEQFRNRRVEKIYHAVVIGKPKQKEGILVNYLVKDKVNMKAVSGGEEKAELSYEVVKTNNKYSLLRIKLATGKFHQIRAQLSMAGFPVLGDIKYGAPSPLPDKSIALCATSLSFGLAAKNETKEVSISAPSAWDKIVA